MPSVETVVDGGNPVGFAVSLAPDGTSSTGGAAGIAGGCSILAADRASPSQPTGEGLPDPAQWRLSIQVYEIVEAM